MTDPATIERLAREAGIDTSAMNMGSGSCVSTEGCNGVAQAEFERFAALVAAQERERCAAVCDIPPGTDTTWEVIGGPEGAELCASLAAAIRAL